MGSNESIYYIFISALLINNFTLSYFLGLCPFLGVTAKITTAFRLGMANIFVMLITAISAYVLNTWVLPYAPYLRLISFIIVIASAVQFVEMAIKKLSPELFRALGIFLPLITTNCAILGLALFQTNTRSGSELNHCRYNIHGIHGFCRTIQLIISWMIY
jgi:electron transport complex protein RnfA